MPDQQVKMKVDPKTFDPPSVCRYKAQAKPNGGTSLEVEKVNIL